MNLVLSIIAASLLGMQPAPKYDVPEAHARSRDGVQFSIEFNSGYGRGYPCRRVYYPWGFYEYHGGRRHGPYYYYNDCPGYYGPYYGDYDGFDYRWRSYDRRRDRRHERRHDRHRDHYYYKRDRKH